MKFTVAIDEHFQGIGLGFQHYFKLFARRAAEGGLYDGNPSHPNPLGPIFRQFTLSIDEILYFLAGYHYRCLTFSQYLVSSKHQDSFEQFYSPILEVALASRIDDLPTLTEFGGLHS